MPSPAFARAEVRALALPRRARSLALAAALVLAASASAQVEVGRESRVKNLIPAEVLENSAQQQYAQVLAQARSQRALAPDSNPELIRLRAIAARLIPYTAQWNPRAKDWKLEVNLIGSRQINAWCMPGGKIAFYTGIIDQLKLTDDEVAMVMGHEMAHALREHARERLVKTQATSLGLSVAAAVLGLGNVGDLAANLGTQLLSMRYSRDDESESDLVGLEIAARAGYNPEASVSLWKKMSAASRNAGKSSFFSTHPSGPERIKALEASLPKVRALYEKARQS